MLIAWLTSFVLGPLVLGAGLFLPERSGLSILFQKLNLIFPSMLGTAFWLWVLPPDLYKFIGFAFILPLVIAIL